MKLDTYIHRRLLIYMIRFLQDEQASTLREAQVFKSLGT